MHKHAHLDREKTLSRVVYLHQIRIYAMSNCSSSLLQCMSMQYVHGCAFRLWKLKRKKLYTVSSHRQDEVKAYFQ